MTIALFAIAGYLLGAVPFGVLISRAHGVDIRQAGSGNIGATNVGRVVGRKWGYFCLVLDILKGLMPTLAVSFFLADELTPLVQLQWLLVGIACVLGHTFSIFLAFRGGKGVATTVGVALGIYPYFTIAIGAALVVYALVRYSTGLVSAGSLAIAVSFPIAFYVYACLSRGLSLEACWPFQAAAILLGLLIIIRHRSNIARLMRGEESRVAAKRDHAS